MNVIISGAGIAGPTLAWWLAKAGMHVVVLEKAPSIPDAGQNIDIDDSARVVIRRMGLEEQVRRHGTGEQGTIVLGLDARPVAEFPLRPGFDVSPTSELEILRCDLANILYNATKDNDQIAYRFGTTIAQVLSNDSKSVEVELSTGEVLKADLLVAADGQWSKTRRQCFPPEATTVRDMNMVAIYGTIPRLPSDRDHWLIYQALGRRIISTRPDSHGTLRTLLTLMPTNEGHRKEWYDVVHQGKAKQLALMRRDFMDAGWESRRIIDSAEASPDFYVHTVEQIRMVKWSYQRVVCVGDAAYAPTQLTGMGTSLAILGAYILAGELSQLQPGEHPERALTLYHATFKPFVEKIQDLPSYVPGIVHPNSRWHRWICHFVLRAVATIITIPWVADTCRAPAEQDFGFPLYTAFEQVSDSKRTRAVEEKKYQA